MAYNFQTIIIDNIFHNCQVATDIRILVAGDNMGNFLGLYDVDNFSRHDGEMGNGAAIEQDHILLIDKKIGITVKLGRSIIKTGPENIPRDSYSIFIIESVHFKSMNLDS